MLDSHEYDMPVSPQKAKRQLSGSNFTYLYMFPIIGVLLIATLISAAIFQWSLSDFVPWLIGLLLILFAAMMFLILWGSTTSRTSEE